MICEVAKLNGLYPAGGGSGDPPMTAFNLDDERATGRFDEDGNYWKPRHCLWKPSRKESASTQQRHSGSISSNVTT